MKGNNDKCNIKGCSRCAKYVLINDGLVVCERCKQALILEGDDKEEDFEEMGKEVKQ